MNSLIIVIPIAISFLASLFFLPFWIRKAKEIGLLWEDMNKFSSESVAGSGGIIAIFAFTLGVLVFVAYRVFILESSQFLIEILAVLTVILILAGVGLIDDLLGWRKGGLSRRYRLLLIAIATVPLVVINAGKSVVSIPFLGAIELGLIYPAVVIPLGIVGSVATYNFLAGFNGLEAGQGILILSGLSIVSYLTGSSWLSVICLVMVGALLGFLVYNLPPARVFPGDSLTYCVGGLIAMVSILGNFEKIAVFFFIPYILETVLKSRGKLKKYSFGKPNEDGSLELRYPKIYSLNHFSIYIMKKANIKPTEKKVVLSIWAFQIVTMIIGFIVFRQGIIG
ncbi:hypothetical protein COU60_00700 [Candidatus Pacearchaeota archaeon CG10_big_fil_rev_8_21_14_0_10_34_76]|nr:MAG: hypothetical protein COU60_00700 [Candidatus Pacearchaeota archaeon CG10_big_fil_rev_8_21_14_0_10_34_76]